ncbi:hypothetical protein [Pseudomonas fluorescens]|uniref:Uncharacterized protein n=1 Tax=Pseudomonas fluorescens TaxID=294 RepID=A0A5E7CKV5_PSEFL|nr:hypothetical protein [Pseudomonas fluorescens]VVO05226.1 hypothetical protein PS691_02951 [Pseudomonas fluorescens]
MALFDYAAYPKNHIHKTKYGEVVANTFKEADEKIKKLFPYPLERTELSLLLESSDTETEFETEELSEKSNNGHILLSQDEDEQLNVSPIKTRKPAHPSSSASRQRWPIARE